MQLLSYGTIFGWV